MKPTETLFDAPAPRITTGRVRKGLEQDVHRARDRDVTLDHGTLALARVLADHLDMLERQVRASQKAYDRVVLATLARQFHDTYSAVFGGTDGPDPFDQAFSELAAAGLSHAGPGLTE